MLRHLHDSPEKPTRVVVLGAGGFLGGAAARRLVEDGVEVLPLGRADLDLTDRDAGDRLARVLREDDTLLMASALAPCKTVDMLVANTTMVASVCRAILTAPPAHVIYLSSDAVYRDSSGPLREESCAEPGSLHGAMHLAREIALRSAYAGPLAILRPTLVYGAADPHNGYGPNRFRRLAAEGREIVLFGEGEERRDHVLADDVAELLRLMVVHRSEGVLNAATGTVASFKEIAERVVALFPRPMPIRSSPRQGPMPHNGYRPFDAGGTTRAFPGFRYTPLAEGLMRVHEKTAGSTTR